MCIIPDESNSVFCAKQNDMPRFYTGFFLKIKETVVDGYGLRSQVINGKILYTLLVWGALYPSIKFWKSKQKSTVFVHCYSDEGLDFLTKLIKPPVDEEKPKDMLFDVSAFKANRHQKMAQEPRRILTILPQYRTEQEVHKVRHVHFFHITMEHNRLPPSEHILKLKLWVCSLLRCPTYFELKISSWCKIFCKNMYVCMYYFLQPYGDAWE
mgnify:CR=1 FL=1